MRLCLVRWASEDYDAGLGIGSAMMTTEGSEIVAELGVGFVRVLRRHFYASLVNNIDIAQKATKVMNIAAENM